MQNTTQSLTNEQITNGTPSMRKFILRSFFKDDKCVISPAKDGNGRYKGIQENIPEFEKLKMGYVPSVESKIRVYDGIEINLDEPQWEKDWEWMKYCKEIADDFASGQGTPGAYFYIYRPGIESAKKVDSTRRRFKLEGYILNDTQENLYNRVKVLGTDMSDSTLSDVQEFLLSMVITNPSAIQNVYESDVYALELLFLHAVEGNVFSKRGGSYVFGDIFLGVDKKGVIAYLGNPRNSSTAATIEAVTYGRNVSGSLADEAVSTDEDLDDVSDLEEREAASEKPATKAAAKARGKK